MSKLYCFRNHCFTSAEKHDKYVDSMEGLWTTINTFTGFALLVVIAFPVINIGFGILHSFPVITYVFFQLISFVVFFISFMKKREYGNTKRFSKGTLSKKRKVREDDIII